MSGVSMPLRNPFRTLLEQGDCAAYLETLCEQGLSWWFEMDTPAILTHLEPLRNFPLQARPQAPPLRLRFLLETAKCHGGLMDTRALEQLCERMVALGDLEGAAAAAGAAVASIWDSGHDFHRYADWRQRIGRILSSRDLSALARASLHGFLALMTLTEGKDLSQACALYQEFRRHAECAGSIPLLIDHAAAAAYCFIWMGRLDEAGMLLDDVRPLCREPEANPVVSLYFETTRGLYHFVLGEHARAERILARVTVLPYLDAFPPPAYFLAHGHRLLAMAASCNGPRDIERIEQAADRIRQRAIPKANHFHFAYFHYSLAAAYLMSGDPGKALLHARQSLERAASSGSVIVSLLPALVEIQALVDTGRHEEAETGLESLLPRWENSGYRILAASAWLESAALHLERGQLEKARQAHERARSLVERPFPPVNRGPTWLQALEKRLFSEPGSLEPDDAMQRPVRIVTLGDFAVYLNGRRLYDRNWRGEQTKRLLKALIVFGGTKVSYERLIDTLWPDAAGDQGESVLKMTLSRLRHLGNGGGGAHRMQWLLVKDKRVSLARPLCAVDALLFQEWLRAAAATKDPAQAVKWLLAAIDLYDGDFLPNDHEEPWISGHRERLRTQYIQAVLRLAGFFLEEGLVGPERTLPVLEQAMERAPDDEELAARLMEIHLMRGYPSLALKVYRRTEAALEDISGIAPGRRLRELAQRAREGSGAAAHAAARSLTPRTVQ